MCIQKHTKDLKNLHKYCGLETNVGVFHQIQCSLKYIYVYMQKNICPIQITLTMLSKLCNVVEYKNYVDACDNHACHEVVLHNTSNSISLAHHT